MKIWFLLAWNVTCLAVPLWLFQQPSPESSIARAVVILLFAGPAAFLAVSANLVFVFVIGRSAPALALLAVSTALAVIWLFAVLFS